MEHKKNRGVAPAAAIFATPVLIAFIAIFIPAFLVGMAGFIKIVQVLFFGPKIGNIPIWAFFIAIILLVMIMKNRQQKRLY